MGRKVAINGFGRIGRGVMRAIIEQGSDLEVVAVNDLTDPATLAHLLKWDSVYGKLGVEVSAEGNVLKVGDRTIQILAERDPAALPWGDLGVEVVLESTGFFTARDKAALHLEAGAKRVLVSAPAKGADLTFVLGVNDHLYDPAQHTVISNASCTTNALAPLAKVLDDVAGIEQGSMSTIHAYTADQRLQDSPHSDLRRARAAALSMIPTSTGAATAIGLVLPQLDGKLTGGSIRVPIPVGSVVELTAVVSREVSREDIIAAYRDAAASGPLQGILEYSEEPLVSADIVGNPHSSIFDSELTLVDGKFVKVTSWYDNEWGFSNRAAQALAKLAG